LDNLDSFLSILLFFHVYQTIIKISFYFWINIQIIFVLSIFLLFITNIDTTVIIATIEIVGTIDIEIIIRSSSIVGDIAVIEKTIRYLFVLLVLEFISCRSLETDISDIVDIADIIDIVDIVDIIDIFDTNNYIAGLEIKMIRLIIFSVILLLLLTTCLDLLPSLKT